MFAGHASAGNAKAKLNVLFSEPGASREKFRSTVVVIPEFDTITVTSWQDQWNNCWLQTRIPAMLPDPCVLGFEPGLRCVDDFSWRSVLELGDSLLHQLLCYDERDTTFKERPLFFIAYGLGGLVVKRAISVLFERFYDPAYREVIGIISGIVFLGCPHPALNSPQDTKRLNALLKATTRLSHKAIQRASSEVSLVANISQNFNDAGTESPILSIYETKLSKVGHSIFSSRQVLVDKLFCETLARQERLLGAECSHDELINIITKTVLGSTLDDELLQFFPLAIDLRSLHAVESSSSAASSSISLPPVSGFSDVHLQLGSSSPRLALNSPTSTNLEPHENDFVQMPILAPNIKLPCYMLGSREPNSDFVARLDVFKTLDQALLPSGAAENANSPRTFAVCGVGGVGKSELAFEYAWSRKHEFDAVFWIHAGDNERTASEFAHIATNLGLVDAEKIGDESVTRRFVLHWLSTATEAVDASKPPVKWFLIFDNAESLSDLKDFWPVAGKGSILITSRDPLAKTRTFFNCPHGMELEPLTTQQSAQWLRSLTRYNSPDNLELSEIIVERLSNLPLAIVQIAGVILRQDLSFQEFLELYEQETFRTNLYSSKYSISQQPIWTSFAFQRLSVEATALLDIICFLNPDSIPEKIFTGTMADPSSKTTILRGFPRSTMAYVAARAELTRASLLRRNVETKQLAIHRIVQDAVLSRMNPVTLLASFRSTLQFVNKEWPYRHKEASDHNAQRWKFCEPLLPHILHLSAKYHMYHDLQEAVEHNNDFGKLLVEAGWYQGEKGMWEESLPQQRLAQSLLERAPVSDNLALAENHVAQSSTGSNINDKDMALAEALKGVQYVTHVEVTNVLLERIGRVYAQVAVALIANKRWDEAQPYNDQALTLFRQIPGHAIHLEFLVFGYIGKAHSYWRKGGAENVKEASRLMEEVQTAREAYFNSEPTLRTAMTWAELGNIRTVQGRHDEALELYLQSFKMNTKIYGQYYFRNAALLAKIGLQFERRSEFMKARDAYHQALSVYEKRTCYIAEITWTSFRYYHTLETLNSSAALKAHRRAEQELTELSLQIGHKITDEELEDLLAWWAFPPRESLSL